MVIITFLNKIQYNFVALPFPSELSLKSSCTRKLPWYTLPTFYPLFLMPTSTPRHFFFFGQCTPMWNSPSSTAVTAPSLSVFTSTAKSYLSLPTEYSLA